MRAMVLRQPGTALQLEDLAVPEPGEGEVRIRIRACAVCRTDLHVVDGELPDPALPLIPGHEIVGEVDVVGPGVNGLAAGDRVGVPWLGWTCGRCRFCVSGRENLCERARFTGYTRPGGYAEYVVADARYCFALTTPRSDVEAAPLLCAGLIGFRAYRMAGEGAKIGLYGFGGAAHILCQLAVADGREVHAFTRPGDERGQRFARELGAAWAGGSDEAPPEPLDAAVLFAPVGALVPTALGHTARGGTVVCAGIHMSDIPAFPYSLLWQERVVRSVANLTRADGVAFFERLAATDVRTEVHPYALQDANRALDDLRSGAFDGAAVLEISPGRPG